MPYNPNRQVAGQPNRRRRIPARTDGKRRSSRVSQEGPRAVRFEDIANRVQTDSGWRLELFSGPDFEMYYQYICAGNHSGTLLHKEGDRCIRVLAGYIYIEQKGLQTKITARQSVQLPRGEEYVIMTSDLEDAEIILSQSAEYEEGMEHLTEAAAQRTIPVSISPREPQERKRVRTEESKAMQQAEALKEKREEAKAKKTPVIRDNLPGEHVPQAGVQVDGVNLKPTGGQGA